MTPSTLLRVLIFWLNLSGCYLSHQVDERDASAPPRDAAPPVDTGPIDTGPPDAGPLDAGPPRPLRWVELATGATERPPGRMNHFAVIDAANDRMIVLGGFDPYCCGMPYRTFSDVWALDLATELWSRLGTLEHPLLGVTPIDMVLDAPRHRLVIVGALFDFDAGPTEDVAVDLATWAITSLPMRPWPRDGEPLRVTYDAAAHRILVNDAYFTDRTEGVWAFDLDTDRWSTLPIAGSPGQLFHTPLVMAGADRALIYSGYDGDTGTSSVWELDLAGARFTLLPWHAEAGGRFSHRAVFEPARGTLAVFGGSLFTVDRATLVLDTTTGALDEPALAPAPLGRRDFTFVLDAARRRAIAYGGAHQSEHTYDDVWALELP